MAFEIIVNSVDRTAQISRGSLEIQDVRTSQVDTARFSVKNKAWTPSKGDEVLIYFDSVLRFGGRVVDVNKVNRMFQEVSVECQDWSVDLDRKRLAKVYINQTAKDIIEDMVDVVNDELGFAFTTANVQETQTLGRVVFNYQEISKCIEDLAKALNMQWYVDADKDIHFFTKGAETAPIAITDDSEDVLQESLEITDSFSELRNVVIVRGGEYVANSRTENFTADGVQATFNLAYKFSSEPTVSLNGTPLDVGIENLDNQGLIDGDFDCLWDYGQKYLRFQNLPALDDELEVVGTPLFPLIVLAEEANSISAFGRKEYIITDLNITSQDVAAQRAVSDLEAYKDGVKAGSFMTYTPGLRSGQIITVNSDMLGVNEVFLVRSVTTSEHGLTGAQYTVELANNRIIGIIEFLQQRLLSERQVIGIRENEVPNLIKLDSQRVGVTETITRMEEMEDNQDIEVMETITFDPFIAEFVLADYFPIDASDPKTPMRLDISSYIY